ncbi:MAG: hypothetical protein K2G05_01170, partial [Duncaniella sp.]|nr:hypothetical protein [Duncaniella sp.]
MELNDPILKPEEVMDTTLNQELPVNQESPEAMTADEETTVAEESTDLHVRKSLTKSEIIDEMRRISELEAGEIMPDSVSRLKQQFYSLRNDELRDEREAYMAVEGNDPEAFVAAVDETEE